MFSSPLPVNWARGKTPESDIKNPHNISVQQAKPKETLNVQENKCKKKEHSNRKQNNTHYSDKHKPTWLSDLSEVLHLPVIEKETKPWKGRVMMFDLFQSSNESKQKGISKWTKAKK